MKTGTVQLGNATIHIGYSQVTKPNQRGMLRELTEFNVPEEFRGKGEGSALLSDICEQADNEGLFLLLLAKDARLANYYARFNFLAITPQDSMMLVRSPNSNAAMRRKGL